jgi:tetratricopeptide (TPR) repeat protein
MTRRSGSNHARANVYYNKGDYDLALLDYNRAIKLEPDFAMAFFNAGGTLLGRGEYDRAIADYDKATRRCLSQNRQDRFGSRRSDQVGA